VVIVEQNKCEDAGVEPRLGLQRLIDAHKRNGDGSGPQAQKLGVTLDRASWRKPVA
jgi:hypothetical protein